MYKQIGKRCLDLLIVLSAFFVLSPLLLLIAVLIKVFDPGPVIFVQERIGRCGERFRFYKFRSMPVNTGNLPSDQIGEVQLTWVGRLIRRTNLDELPQLYNILKGDMSVVGPRPPIPGQLELIELRRANGSLQCLPGLTGLAQVNSFDGMSIAQKAAFDGNYANNVSLSIDFKIIFETLNYLVKPPPTY